MMTPEQRRARAQLAANIRWTRAGERARQSQAVREAYWRRMARQVDPDQSMDPAERRATMAAAARAESARMNLARTKKQTS